MSYISREEVMKIIDSYKAISIETYADVTCEILSLPSLPDNSQIRELIEPLQFTMYDFRGPWASDESKICIMEQHNRKIMEHYHQLPPQ